MCVCVCECARARARASGFVSGFVSRTLGSGGESHLGSTLSSVDEPRSKLDEGSLHLTFYTSKKRGSD